MTQAASASGNDVRDQPRFEGRDFVTKPQFSLLEPRHPQLIGDARPRQRGNCLVEIAVLELQGIEAFGQVAVVHAQLASPLRIIPQWPKRLKAR
jgi:hypothetical protein